VTLETKQPYYEIYSNHLLYIPSYLINFLLLSAATVIPFPYHTFEGFKRFSYAMYHPSLIHVFITKNTLICATLRA
jgi:hypothetical protein